MEYVEIKCVGTSRCCRQVLLQKMYNREHPFEYIYTIMMVPAEYLGYKTLQIFVNNIDIGFISREDVKRLHEFHSADIRCTVRYSQKTKHPHYDFYISGTDVFPSDYDQK